MAKKRKLRGFEVTGHLDIVIHNCEDEDEGEIRKWQEVQIHGDPEGLRTFAELLIKIADLNQEQVNETELPTGAREHYHLRPIRELGKSSVETIVGRLDAKGTGKFYNSYIPKDAIK